MKSKLINVAILAALGFVITPLQAGEGHTNSQSHDTVQGNAAENGANTGDNQNMDNMNRDPIEAEDFVEEASAKGVAEIETAKMALEEGTSKVHEFANQMIQDHTKANNELKKIAQQGDMEISDDATLIDQAKAMMLSIRDGESFDEAYIENQISAHEQTIELFERASHSDNAAIKAFANEKLPKLRDHLQMAKALKDHNDD